MELIKGNTYLGYFLHSAEHVSALVEMQVEDVTVTGYKLLELTPYGRNQRFVPRSNVFDAKQEVVTNGYSEAWNFTGSPVKVVKNQELKGDAFIVTEDVTKFKLPAKMIEEPDVNMDATSPEISIEEPKSE